MDRDFIKYPDFERTIRKFNLQLMAGLGPEDPDYSSVCFEMFAIVSTNTQQSSANFKSTSGVLQKSNSTMKSSLVNSEKDSRIRKIYSPKAK